MRRGLVMRTTMIPAAWLPDATGREGQRTRRQVLASAAAGAVATLGMTSLSCSATAAQAGHLVAHPSPGAIPGGYRLMGRRHGVAPVVLYAVALQESAMLFGQHVLPWPWTLNVAGQPRRFDSYEAAVRALRTAVSGGQPSVDCGLLQVNWRYHHERLGSYWAALDPYPNISVGAGLLREHFVRTSRRRAAVGRYHSEANQRLADAYSREVFAGIEKLQRSGAATSEDLHA